MSEFRACAVIPTCNHHKALSDILLRFITRDIAVIIVDDGSDPDEGERIAAIWARSPEVECLRSEVNEGKGSAVVRGLARAAERGFTHAVQIDADGQHDIDRLDALLAAARSNPEALVSGQPEFDDTVPLERKAGRWLTHVWVFINTLSFDITDSMCGFRVYPVAATLDVAHRDVRGRRMDFDTEVLVRSHWRGTPFVGVPVRVTYPAGNVSNFDVLRDNVLVSAMHARLFFGMLVRSPRLLMRNFFGSENRTMRSDHWADLSERGACWGLRFLAAVYRLLGRRICFIVMVVPVFYFFLTGRKHRQASFNYLNHAWKAGIFKRKPNCFTSFRHFLAFGAACLDKFAAWTGNLADEDLDGVSLDLFTQALNDERGAFVITAHLGNPEVLRAVGTIEGWRINVLVHTVHAERFNRLMEAFSPESATRLTQVTDLGPETAVAMSESAARGEWVVMVGDRIAVGEQGNRVAWIPFLGELAPFPVGPYILASLLRCPTYLLFGLRRGGRYHVHFRKLADRVELPRRNRAEAIRSYVQVFVSALEEHTAMVPLQWFNFFDFWRPPGLSAPAVDSNKEPAGDVHQ